VEAPAEEGSLQAVIAEAEGRHEDALAAFRVAEQGWNDIDEPFETAMAELGTGR
jgi:hypothetical protein